MHSFKDTRDFVLLSYDVKLITDDEFGLLYDTYSSPNLDLPYDSLPPFDLSLLNEDECSAQFRFKKADIPTLKEALQIPLVIRGNQSSVCDETPGGALWEFLGGAVPLGLWNP